MQMETVLWIWWHQRWRLSHKQPLWTKNFVFSFQTPLDVFAEMEKSALLSETDVSLLHKALQECDQQLAITLEEYTQGIGSTPYTRTCTYTYMWKLNVLVTPSNDCDRYRRRSATAAVHVTPWCQHGYWGICVSVNVCFWAVNVAVCQFADCFVLFPQRTHEPLSITETQPNCRCLY